jgi:hypothetical protein
MCIVTAFFVKVSAMHSVLIDSRLALASTARRPSARRYGVAFADLPSNSQLKRANQILRQDRPHRCDPPMNQDRDVLLFDLERSRNLLVVLPASPAQESFSLQRR